VLSLELLSKSNSRVFASYGSERNIQSAGYLAKTLPGLVLFYTLPLSGPWYARQILLRLPDDPLTILQSVEAVP